MNKKEKLAIDILKTFEFRRRTKNYNKLSLEDSQSVDIVLDLIDKLQKELEQERKLTNLIIDDFQAENYFINMTNKEVRKYYSKREELK